MVNFINKSFHHYFFVFPAIGTFVVALLLYGLVKLWEIDPQSNIMFPLCAIRCTFETLSPMSIAGEVHSASESVISNWKGMIGKKRCCEAWQYEEKRKIKLASKLHTSCKPFRCSSGNFFAFTTDLVLVTGDTCFNQTVNLLVTFPEL